MGDLHAPRVPTVPRTSSRTQRRAENARLEKDAQGEAIVVTLRAAADGSKSAQEEDAARKASAQAKAAALYKRLEEEKQAKKIVKMDHLPPESNKKRKGKVPIHTPGMFRLSSLDQG